MSDKADKLLLGIFAIVIVIVIALASWGWNWGTNIQNIDVKGQIQTIRFSQAPGSFLFNNATCATFTSRAIPYCFKTKNTSFVNNFKNVTYMTSNVACEYKAKGINLISLTCD